MVRSQGYYIIVWSHGPESRIIYQRLKPWSAVKTRILSSLKPWSAVKDTIIVWSHGPESRILSSSEATVRRQGYYHRLKPWSGDKDTIIVWSHGPESRILYHRLKPAYRAPSKWKESYFLAVVSLGGILCIVIPETPKMKDCRKQ